MTAFFLSVLAGIVPFLPANLWTLAFVAGVVAGVALTRVPRALYYLTAARTDRP